MVSRILAVKTIFIISNYWRIGRNFKPAWKEISRPKSNGYFQIRDFDSL